ncbi:MAG TPA: carboxypeptidase regulatory-like domain-containing protein [Terriglobales bacterium]|nr:carboxypeptidase regulatory-like domain-containing protein [Terriglobales bacterium]
MSKYRVAIAFAAALLSLAPAPLRGDDEARLAFEGFVKDALGTPVAGALVQLEQTGGSISTEAKTDPAGKFAFSLRAPGTYLLRVQKAGFDEARETLQIPLTQKSCEIALTRSRTAGKAAEEMQLSDNTNFTVAGITDWTAAGGHGSDVSLRTSEVLAKETRGLGNDSPPMLPTPGSLQKLQQERDELHAELKKKDNSDLHRRLADIDEQLHDPLNAEREYERATQLDPSERNYFAWATELLLHRAIQPALEVFTKGADAHPQSERMLAGLGAALYSSGLYPQAAEKLCAASDLNPNDSIPYLFLGKMVQASPQPLPCSEEKLARFAHDQPTNAYADYYYALALWKRSSALDRLTAEQVESLLKRAIAANANFAEAYLQLGIAYSSTGEDAKAIAEYERAVDANPQFGEGHFRLAQAYKKSGELAKAQREFRTYEQIQKTEAAAVEQQRREVRQFVVVFRDQPKNSPN